MTRIPKTSSIDTLHNIERTNSRSVKKQPTATPQKPSRLDLAKLEQQVRILIQKDERPQQKIRAVVVKEIIKWQFGEQAFANSQFIRAFDKLSKATEDSPIYKELMEKFLKRG